MCRQLGFGGAARISVRSEFGQVDKLYAMEKVRCKGNESTIQECKYSLSGDCYYKDGAGVVCQRKYN